MGRGLLSIFSNGKANQPVMFVDEYKGSQITQYPPPQIESRELKSPAEDVCQHGAKKMRSSMIMQGSFRGYYALLASAGFPSNFAQ